jgi:hypothetical protein
MNTIQETKARLRTLALALATILDNYGINTDQQPNYNMQRQELEDIIANIADTPPPAPITVDDVVAAISAKVGDVLTEFGVVGSKVDALIALANAHGEAQQAASAA